MRGASHQFLEHTSELELRVCAPTLSALMREAGLALGHLMLGGSAPSGAVRGHTLRVHSSDRAALLVDWLNELIYRAEVEHWVPVEIEVVSVSDTGLQVRVRGTDVKQAPALVKAATLHTLRVEEVDEGFEAKVTLDI